MKVKGTQRVRGILASYLLILTVVVCFPLKYGQRRLVDLWCSIPRHLVHLLMVEEEKEEGVMALGLVIRLVVRLVERLVVCLVGSE